MTSEEFRRIRLKLDLNQEQFATLLGMSSKQAISNIETGIRKPGSLVGIILGVLDDLPKRKAEELTELMLNQGRKRR
jgi:transcriptional regulator with XRE-family HTH domain